MSSNLSENSTKAAVRMKKAMKKTTHILYGMGFLFFWYLAGLSSIPYF